MVVALVLVICTATVLLFQTFAVAADPIGPVITRDYAKCHDPSRAAAEQRLVAAGYVHSNGYFAKPARSNVPGCTLSYYVITRHDSADAVTMAFAEVASVCK